ncbi:conjugative transposon protein TraM [Olivibacter sp. 47]|uniref:conjugative transposon protein TraM n=1 Tax=Olivibacter sp. 47 TaxID=3056486 RepID=UPI0025A47CC4|nr:conjugative transposon protein TraM [Olivibacter sp. 47]MDM8172956.1 conjugative transposon protein TraM [Olivibacter sp. 47]
MDFYRQATRDEEKKQEGIENVINRLGFSLEENPKAEEIDEKLKAIRQEINGPQEKHEKFPFAVVAENPMVEPSPKSEMNSEVDRLEALMKSMHTDSADDREVEQLNGLLQTILDIQHPERVKEKLQSENEIIPEKDSLFKAIPAIITNKQKVVQGATVRLQLQDSMDIKGHHIPKGFYLFATCRIANQRIMLNIRNIRLGTSIIPVNLSVYSLDGMEGLYAPEAVITEAANLGTDNLVRGMGMYGLDGSIATQVAGAGMEAAKNIISKKVRKIKVKVKAGESVLLKNNDLKNTR